MFGLKNGLTTVPRVEVVGIDQIEVLVILPPDHRIAATDSPWKQSHSLVARRRSAEWSHPERSEIHRFEQLGTDRPAAIGRVGGVVDFSSIVVKFNESCVFDAVCLGVGDRKDDPLAQ